MNKFAYKIDYDKEIAKDLRVLAWADKIDALGIYADEYPTVYDLFYEGDARQSPEEIEAARVRLGLSKDDVNLLLYAFEGRHHVGWAYPEEAELLAYIMAEHDRAWPQSKGRDLPVRLRLAKRAEEFRLEVAEAGAEVQTWLDREICSYAPDTSDFCSFPTRETVATLRKKHKTALARHKRNQAKYGS